MSRTSNSNNVAQAQAQAKVILNFAKTTDNFISDFNTVGQSILDYKVKAQATKDAKDAYTGTRKDVDGKLTDAFKAYVKPYTKDEKDAKDIAVRNTSRFLAYYGQDKNVLKFENNDAVIDLNALLVNMGALQGGTIADVTKEKQVKAINGLMTGITGRVKTTATAQAKYNNVLKFGTVKVLEDNVIDTFLMLEVALTAHTCLKSCYTVTGQDGDRLVPLCELNDNDNVIQTSQKLSSRVLVNTVKTPLTAQTQA